MAASTKPPQEWHSKYSDVFSGIGCFKGTFFLQVKEGMKPYQAPPMCTMVQQLHHSTNTKWHGMPVHGPHMTQQGAYKTNSQGTNSN